MLRDLYLFSFLKLYFSEYEEKPISADIIFFYNTPKGK